jgi:DNA-binding CsgD family transcriptional regulator
LRAAIALAAKDESQIGKTGLAIRLTEVTAVPMFAHVLPMGAGDLRTRLVPASIAAIFIGASPDEQDGAETMAAAFGLTPAETRVLASLLGGRTVAETAAALGVAITTARTHLDNIFAKTGVSRQAELVRLASQIVPPANQPD